MQEREMVGALDFDGVGRCLHDRGEVIDSGIFWNEVCIGVKLRFLLV